MSSEAAKRLLIRGSQSRNSDLSIESHPTKMHWKGYPNDRSFYKDQRKILRNYWKTRELGAREWVSSNMVTHVSIIFNREKATFEIIENGLIE